MDIRWRCEKVRGSVCGSNGSPFMSSCSGIDRRAGWRGRQAQAAGIASSKALPWQHSDSPHHEKLKSLYVMTISVYHSVCACNCLADPRLFLCAPYKATPYLFHMLSRTKQINYQIIRAFGGLAVACWPLVPKFAGSNPAEAVGFLGRKKSSARLPSEGK